MKAMLQNVVVCVSLQISCLFILILIIHVVVI